MKGLLKLGDVVSWKGAFGIQEAKDAIVTEIEENCINKSGDSVNSIEWNKVNSRSVIVSLDNGSWAYGTQLKEK